MTGEQLFGQELCVEQYLFPEDKANQSWGWIKLYFEN